MANANTNGKKHGKLELHLYSTGRAGECSTDKCHDRRTLIYHRGTLGWSPSFICEDCLADLLEAYVRLVGKDKANMSCPFRFRRSWGQCTPEARRR